MSEHLESFVKAAVRSMLNWNALEDWVNAKELSVMADSLKSPDGLTSTWLAGQQALLSELRGILTEARQQKERK